MRKRTLLLLIPLLGLLGCRSDLDFHALARCESTNNPHAVGPGGHQGLYQFDRQTWQSVGGTWPVIDRGPHEQTARAYLLYLKRGRQPWPHCGRFL